MQRRFIISGKVQGVWFRESTKRKALSLGLTGKALNLEDGCVEVLADGPADELALLEQWLHKGPPLASVNKVKAADAAFEAVDGFTTG